MPSATDWLDVSEKRLELLSAVCRNNTGGGGGGGGGGRAEPLNKFVMDRIFVCDKHKILFCQTPKVGNTQWKKVLIVLNGRVPGTRGGGGGGGVAALQAPVRLFTSQP